MSTRLSLARIAYYAAVLMEDSAADTVLLAHEYIQALEMRETDLKFELGRFSEAAEDVIRRFAGDPEAPDSITVINALTNAILRVRKILETPDEEAT